jgi:HK97 family phage major capsid protein
MNTVAAIKAERSHLAREMRGLLAQRPGKLFGAKEQRSFDERLLQMDRLDSQLAELETPVVADEHLDAATAPTGVATAWLRGGVRALSPAQVAVYNTLSSTSGSQGGFTVPATVSRRLIDALKDFSGVRRVAEVVVTESGGPLSLPTSDGTSEVAELLVENATATAANPSFGTATLNSFKYSSKIFTLPVELLQDSEIDIEQFVLDRAAARIGRLTNTHFTVGTGSGQPQGFVGVAAVGKTGAVGQTATFTHDDIVDLMHSVDPAYRQDPRGGVAFMLSDAGLKAARKLRDTAGRPLYFPSDGSTPDRLLGYDVVVNNDVPTAAASAKTIFFGNWRQGYKVRDVLEMQLRRFDDAAYLRLGQVAFLAIARCGGNLVNTAAVKCYQHSAT